MTFKNEISLDDLSLFLAVAETGSLTRGATRAGSPVPTVSRRMRQLESRLQRALFVRGAQGMTLTEEGRALEHELRGLQDIRHRVLQWCANTQRTPVVRITAGDWTAAHLARSLPPSDAWHPAFVPTTASLDLARREADIGIRAASPEHPWLARQKMGTVRYAIYGRDAQVAGFIGPSDPDTAGPSQRWLHKTHGAEITCTTSDARLCVDLAQAGKGRVVLPMFIGDATAGLLRLSDPIQALTHVQWLVSHRDTRHDPPIRAALTQIADVLRA
ncbi:LysR family transcriptional regulator [Nereida sp. MMG025]|uniref:LysR family transcriptional regulator n=1 Tax=Nereida sp. MMG025 TaxID=2909981 RepID=UPI001F294B78|nr:LysR family transcriptional regulator [Nereida sp. MMG025]MCF6445094.1 LysR family transcriptional regulator [Nereida sp. MMG025]